MALIAQLAVALLSFVLPATSSTTPDPVVVVPHQLQVIRWCEAGAYIGRPYLQTNYRARTHSETGSSGGYQILASTWRAWASGSGRGLRYRAAYLAPPYVQDWVAVWGYRHSGSSPWNASRGCWGRRR